MMKVIKSYGFGYDVDNVREVQTYVIDNYDQADYNIQVATGDDVMNHMTIHRADDHELDQLIDSCDGAGDFQEA